MGLVVHVLLFVVHFGQVLKWPVDEELLLKPVTSLDDVLLLLSDLFLLLVAAGDDELFDPGWKGEVLFLAVVRLHQVLQQVVAMAVIETHQEVGNAHDDADTDRCVGGQRVVMSQQVHQCVDLPA